MCFIEFVVIPVKLRMLEKGRVSVELVLKLASNGQNSKNYIKILLSSNIFSLLSILTILMDLIFLT